MHITQDHHNRMRNQNAVLREFYAATNAPQINSYPQTIQILPSFRCNYRCKMCFISPEKLGTDEEIDFAALEKLKPALPFVESIYLTGGEPLLYSRFDDLAAMSKDHGCALTMSTNGSLISHNFDRIVSSVTNLKVSIDAATSATYKNIRIGGNFNKVVTSLLEITKWKIANASATPVLELSFVAMHSNVHELSALVELAAKLGVTKVTAQYMGNKSGKEELKSESLFNHQDYSDEHFMKAMDTAKRAGVIFSCRSLFNQKNNDTNKCEFSKTPQCKEPWRYMVISPNGNVAPCCPMPKIMGNLNESSFDEIWNNENYHYFRSKINTDSEPPECAGCTNCKIDLSKKETLLGETD